MEQDLISVHPTTPAREAAALLTTYGLRALPVVDDEGDMLGIITFDDALDILLLIIYGNAWANFSAIIEAN